MNRIKGRPFAVGDRACVAVTDHPCFGWVGRIVDEMETGNPLGPFYRLRLDDPMPAEIKPVRGRHEINHMLGLYACEMRRVDP